MLDLHFSSSLDRLVPVFAEAIRAAWKDPFDPPALVVPNPAVGKWLKMRLADLPAGEGASSGCVANLDSLALERYLWRSLAPGDDMELLDAARMQQVLCALLDEERMSRPAYGPLKDYLCGEGGGIDPLKRVQLSARIARQFLEYEYNRPSVWDAAGGTWRKGADQSWLDGGGGDYFGGTSPHEAWQKDLYRLAVECLERQKNPGYITLPRLYRLRRENAKKAWRTGPGEVFLFGITKISHFHRNTLVEISQMPGVDMRVFLTNPCAEFWEDVNTDRGRRLRRRWNSRSDRTEAGITPRRPDDYGREELHQFAGLPRDHALLRLWGDAGKENIFLWCALADWSFEYHDPGLQDGGAPDTLLGAVQSGLLSRDEAAGDFDGALHRDGTLEILSCPDPGREVEELRERILDLAHEKKIRRLNEVAVYLPDPAAYLPYIHRVFGAYPPGHPLHIPFTVIGAPGGDSVFARGIQVFLEIAAGAFDRSRFFSLVRNPIVQSSRGIDPARVAVWERWADDAGLYRGYDRGHREELGDRGLAVTDAHTFSFVMARMLIGNLASGPVDLGFSLPGVAPGRGGLPLPPYRDFDSGDADLLESFCAVVEELHCDVESLRASLGEDLVRGIDVLAGLVGRWFGTIDDEAGVNAVEEARVRREFLAGIRLIKLQKTLAKRDRVPLKELIVLVRECLPAELPSFSNAWTGGITFAPLRPSMVVPHRVLFVLGLDAAAFPGTSERPAWDLVSRKRIIGDSDAVRDNRFAFLETLHAARERLFLSFRGRDMQKEEELQPSSVVLELEAYLAARGLRRDGAPGGCAARRELPWIVHESIDVMRRNGRPHGSWDRGELDIARLAGSSRLEHRHDLAATGGPAGPAPVSGGTLRTSVYHLRKFFANPLEYHLSRTLGIELDDEPETSGVSDEPLDSGNLALAAMQKKIWAGILHLLFPERAEDAVPDRAALVGGARDIANRLYDGHVAAGQSPEAQFCRMERNYMVQWAERCADGAMPLGEFFPDHRLVENTDLSLGREGAASELVIPLGGDLSCVVECRHEAALVPRRWEGEGDRVGIAAVARGGKNEPGSAGCNPDLWLAGLAQWFAGQNAGGGGRAEIVLVQLNRDLEEGPAFTRARMNAGAGERDIGAWLSGRLREMLVGRCSDHLPFVSVRKIYNGKKDSARTWDNLTAGSLADELQSERGAYRCYLEAFAIADARPPAVDDAQKLRDMARERFAPILEWWMHEEL